MNAHLFHGTHYDHADEPVPGVASGGMAAFALFVVSFLALFLELVLIRWIPSAVHVVAFFNNLILIASFLGLGVGMARPQPLPEALWRLAFRLAVTVGVLTTVGVVNPTVQGAATGDIGLNEMTMNLAVQVPLPLVLLAVFSLTVWTMLPVGEMVAACFDRLERIPAYSVNIGGSLAGVLGFAVMSWLQLPPFVWFALVIGAMFLIHRHWSYAVPGAMILACLLIQHYDASAGGHRLVRWSPYYKVIVRPLVDAKFQGGFMMDVNDQFLLSGFDLRPQASLDENRVADQTRIGSRLSDEEALGAAREQIRGVALLKSYYNFPFRLRPAKRVLILGSGAGNDVAAALRSGAEHVTAVEIDPSVLAFGKAYHPERPYESPNVEIVCDDARAFLNRTTDSFDLIIFATLDAHGLISSVGNVRLDSFIYTKESLALARSRLSPEGLLVLSFGPFREETQYRQYATVRTVFDAEPAYFEHRNRHRTLVAGNLQGLDAAELPAVGPWSDETQEWRRIDAAEITAKLQKYPHALLPSTDDWPHLYLREQRVPAEYLGVLGGVLLLSVLLVAWRFRGDYSLNGHFFFLGAGFLLMETKSVTEFALLIGSTWQVNVLVFSVILVMILAANQLVLRGLRRVPIPACYGLLAISLVMGYLFPPSAWASGASGIHFLLAALYVGVPIFLAGIIFAATFAGSKLASAALASNILGSVLGGCTEYLSLALGLRALSLLALAMYSASALCLWWQSSRASAGGYSTGDREPPLRTS